MKINTENPSVGDVVPPVTAGVDPDIDRITTELQRLSDTDLACVLSNIEARMASLKVGEVDYNTADSDHEKEGESKPKPICKFCNTRLYKTKKTDYVSLGYCAKCSSSQNTAGTAFYTIEQKRAAGDDKK